MKFTSRQLHHLSGLFLLATGLIACSTDTPREHVDQTAFSAQSQTIDSTDRDNNFYNNVESYPLHGSPIEITGEIENPGTLDFSALPKRSVIVKEALLNNDGTNSFIGAYRYDGYSLFDILTNRYLDKANKEEFPPIIDLYVEIENDKGETVVLSWGEIFYPNILHQIIIATDVARIIPSKSKDHWPLPTECKLVVVNDLLTERNISNPVKISVHSCTSTFPINRDLSPCWSPEIQFSVNPGTTAGSTTQAPSSSLNNTTPAILSDIPEVTLHTIFYGRGRGIHSTQPFTGYPLMSILNTLETPGKKALQNGLILIVGADGYRCMFSLSEIVNRNDQSNILIVPVKQGPDDGHYRLFPSCDFFSDRAVKAITQISRYQ